MTGATALAWCTTAQTTADAVRVTAKQLCHHKAVNKTETGMAETPTPAPKVANLEQDATTTCNTGGPRAAAEEHVTRVTRAAQQGGTGVGMRSCLFPPTVCSPRYLLPEQNGAAEQRQNL